MENSFDEIEILISRVLAGEATAEEMAALNNWRQLSSQNEEHFVLSKKLFDTIAANTVTETFNIDSAWNQLDARISNTETKIIPINRRFGFAKVAAAVLFLVTLAFITRLIFINDSSENATVLYAGKMAGEKTLPDGSKVFMNKNAELSYETKKGVRMVKLKGEAYFDVVHNEAEPFEIVVDDVFIKDIGTSFNVKAIPGTSIVEVAVESGEVQFFTEANKGLNLVKGEKAVYDKNTKTFSKSELKAGDNASSYRSKIFHFDNASLNEVITLINDVYESDIRLANEKLGNCRLSVDFNNENLDVMISVLAETLELEIERKSNTILLKGAACPE